MIVCMYSCFVNGVCMYGVAVVEALWRPTGIYWNLQCLGSKERIVIVYLVMRNSLHIPKHQLYM